MKKQTNLKNRQPGNEKEFAILTKSFDERYSKSDDKEALLNREIEAHELLFDDKKLPLWTNVFSNNRPLKQLNVYTDGDIVQIREAYHKYIVNGVDINNSGEIYIVNSKDMNNFYQRRPPTPFQIHYYNEAKKRFGYLNWLRTFVKEANEQPQIEKKLSLKEVALICVYEGRAVTRDNGDDIVKDYKQSSGESLYQNYLKCYKRKDRIAIETSRLKTLNKIARIEKIISHLSKSVQKSAIDEVNTLKAALDKETF